MIKTYSFLLFTLLTVACNKSEEKKPIATVEEISIINLYDAFGKSNIELTKDYGFSALINYKGKIILFDAGNNADILKNNVEALGIDLTSIDFVIGSHAHGDHLNGLDFLLKVNPNVKIYLPADIHLGAPFKLNVDGKQKNIIDSLPVEMRYFDGNRSENNEYSTPSGRFWNANIEYISKNTLLENGISLISTKSPNMGYAGKFPKSDELMFLGLRELSLSISSENGEIVIVGCSHSTTEQIVQKTKEFTNREIELLYGGYHLIPYEKDEIIEKANMLKYEYNVKKVAPAHCSGHLAFKLFKDIYGSNYLYAGLGEKTIIAK